MLSACGSTFAGYSDLKCTTDADCPTPQRCVEVHSIRVGTGDCLASSGATVCRPLCADCASSTPCGCQCP
jgi:hypothetical protein